MKIAYIVGQFPKLSETFILDQITGAIDLGHEVDIFARTNPRQKKTHREVEEYQLLARTHYFREPRQKWALLLRALLLLLRNFHKGPWKIMRSFIVAKRFKLHPLAAWLYVIPFLGKSYDIIHCHFGPNGFIGVFLKELGVKGKVVISFHGFDISRSIVGNMHIYDNLFQKADLVMPVSNRFRERLIDLGCGEPKIVVHRCGVNMAEFMFRERRLEEGGNINLLTVARLTEKKGVEYSLRAMAQLMPKYPHLFYRIAGDGPLRLELEALSCQLGLEKVVTFLGSIEHEEVKRLTMASHIFILPSVTARDNDQEGVPVTLMEALASGIPVVSTTHSGIPELVVDGMSGFLVPERDADALAESLDHLIQHPELWSEMGQAGRQFVEEHFDIDKLNQRLVEIYQGLVEGIPLKTEKLGDRKEANGQGDRLAVNRWIKAMLQPFLSVHIGSYIRALYFWREVERLPVECFHRVLDAGCGDGRYALQFARRYPHAEVVGYDIRDTFIADARSPNLHLETRDLLAMDEGDAFDFVYCIDVLEHIPDNDKVIANFFRALRPSGYFYLHIPYDVPGKHIFPEHWFASSTKWSDKEHIGEQYNLEEGSLLLSKEGFQIIKAQWTFGFWGELAWELDYLTRARLRLFNAIMAPFLKAIGHLDLITWGDRRRGNVLIIAKKA